MTPAEGRVFWKALMDNASALITDAHLLLTAGSVGRARSLTVLAQEELGKALWVNETFFEAWSTGDTEPRTVDRLARDGRSHTQKFLQASTYGDDLDWFWGHYEALDKRRDGESWEDMFSRRREEAEAAALAANRDKQRGFYVDRDDAGVIHTPDNSVAKGIADDLQRAAQVVEMMLIRDHTRMKHDASTEYDSTHEQQHRLLPISHPEHFTERDLTRRGPQSP